MRNKLNAAQHQAVTHAKGPAMVLAGPGSGKTYVIVNRLKYLIEDFGADPAQILVITFTKASAIEMQIRFLKLTDSSYPEVSFGTFHSIFYQIIRTSLSDKNSHLTIADTKFQTEMIRDILASMEQKKIIGHEEHEDAKAQIPDILSEISRLKNLDLTAENCREGMPLRHAFGEIFDSYSRRLREFGRIDFDDMLRRCYEILSDNSSILEFYRKKYRFILIDEYQDINPMQSKVVELLLGEEKNIFAVGDDDQSIYGFRGSDPGIMLEFSDRYKNPAVINLDINYRSGSDILRSAGLVIAQNTRRLEKSLSAFGGNGRGRVIARRYESRKRQNEAIALFLDKHRGSLKDIAILYRTNSEARGLLASLKEYDIPTNLDFAEENIYRDKAVDIIISYLSFAYGGRKRSDFLRIMNVPMRYISREVLSSETVREKELLDYYKGNPQRLKAVKSLFRTIEMAGKMRPSLSVKYLRTITGIDKLYEGSKDALDELERDAKKFENTLKFLEYAAGEKDKEQKSRPADTAGDRVNLMTMHGSKGLEFNIVWLPDLNEGIIPSRSAVGGQQIEEERRMLYVAMTRAKQALIMSYIKGTEENPMLPSRFLRPIKDLWDNSYKNQDQRSSEPSSGSSTSSSNSASSR